MIDEKININIFDNWASKGKDEGMERGHAFSVDCMLKIINDRTDILKSNFKFLDIGCGNGWVVRKFSNNYLCDLSIGIDGSKNMIEKAKLKDSKGKYYKTNIEAWKSKEKFNIVFSMETFYYLKNIDNVLRNISSSILKNDGFIVIGIDHYLENKPSLSWEDEIGIQTQTLSIDQWKEKLRKNNFNKIEHITVGEKDDWAGTLILSAFKN